MGQLLKKKYGVLRAGFFHGAKGCVVVVCVVKTREGECLVIDAACVFFLELGLILMLLGWIDCNYSILKIWVSTNLNAKYL